MSISLALSLTVLIIPSTLLVHLLWAPKNALACSLPIKIFLGAGLGFGMSSVFLFLWLIVFGSLSQTYVVAETLLALLTVVSLFYMSRRFVIQSSNAVVTTKSTTPNLSLFTSIVLLVSAACIFVTALVTRAREPHGQGDATAIWNLIARFVFRGGHEWSDTLTHRLAWTHSDYPLLLPLSVARMWAYANETQVAPILIALIFTFGTLGLLVSSTSLLRTRTQGYLAGLVLLEPFLFFRIGTYQYADTPLGFFLLALLVLFCLYDKSPPEGRGLLILAGMMTGFAAWTKNEGLLILLAVVIGRVIAVTLSQNLRTCLIQMVYFAVGVVPSLSVVAYFKIAIAPANDLVAGQSLGATSKRLLDFSRYVTIVRAFVNQLTGFRKWYLHPTYLLVIYAWLLGVKVDRSERTSILTLSTALGLILAGYFFTYVTTPRDLAWQLTFSLDRLLIQLWPSLVFFYFLLVDSPEKAIAAKKLRASTT